MLGGCKEATKCGKIKSSEENYNNISFHGIGSPKNWKINDIIYVNVS